MNLANKYNPSIEFKTNMFLYYKSNHLFDFYQYFLFVYYRKMLKNKMPQHDPHRREARWVLSHSLLSVPYYCNVSSIFLYQKDYLQNRYLLGIVVIYCFSESSIF